jgi:hypothetical protein
MPAYNSISTFTTTSSASSINFTGIPNTYTHLKLVVSSSSGIAAFDSVNLRIGNNTFDSANNYSYLALINDGNIAKANQGNTYSSIYGFVPEANAPFMGIFYLFNYASTNMYKTVMVDGGNAYSGTKYISKHICTWRNTVAVNQIELGPNSSSFNAGTTATLFGISAV